MSLLLLSAAHINGLSGTRQLPVSTIVCCEQPIVLLGTCMCHTWVLLHNCRDRVHNAFSTAHTSAQNIIHERHGYGHVLLIHVIGF